MLARKTTTTADLRNLAEAAKQTAVDVPPDASPFTAKTSALREMLARPGDEVRVAV
jgi:hypothetical protein